MIFVLPTLFNVVIVKHLLGMLHCLLTTQQLLFQLVENLTLKYRMVSLMLSLAHHWRGKISGWSVLPMGRKYSRTYKGCFKLVLESLRTKSYSCRFGITLKCLNIGTPKTINFPFVPNFGTPKDNKFHIWNEWKIYCF